MSDTQAAQTIVAIIAGAVVVVAAIVILAIIMVQRERAIKDKISKQSVQITELQKDFDEKRAGAKQFATLEDLMKPYKKHLLQSAFDLQSRLAGQVGTNFLNTFYQRTERDREYAIDSTTYFFAEFLSWLEVIRKQVVFVTGSEYAESLNSLLDAIRFQLTGETPWQGFKKGATVNDDTFDAHSNIMQLYIVDIRSIGNCMLHEVDKLLRPITVDTFLQRMKSQKTEDKAIQSIIQPLHDSLAALAKLDKASAPIRRLAILQVLLCKLIDILDNALPWDFGPKFDSNEEPRYIQRDMRMTPMVKHLSNVQKEYLRTQVFFVDDPNLSFPGFREDMADKTQAERDSKLWAGACPPREPRQRPDNFKKAQPFTQGSSVGATTMRKRTGFASFLSGPAGPGPKHEISTMSRYQSHTSNKKSITRPASAHPGGASVHAHRNHTSPGFKSVVEKALMSSAHFPGSPLKSFAKQSSSSLHTIKDTDVTPAEASSTTTDLLARESRWSSLNDGAAVVTSTLLLPSISDADEQSVAVNGLPSALHSVPPALKDMDTTPAFLKSVPHDLPGVVPDGVPQRERAAHDSRTEVNMSTGSGNGRSATLNLPATNAASHQPTNNVASFVPTSNLSGGLSDSGRHNGNNSVRLGADIPAASRTSNDNGSTPISRMSPDSSRGAAGVGAAVAPHFVNTVAGLHLPPMQLRPLQTEQHKEKQATEAGDIESGPFSSASKQ
ncbi:hypothetical protein CEUSTIGMA_g12342.t1 [Chlamydomonas eustigma]|uniref:Uncharacterized protein n=1 Tax=Chlamydomonas eustigma TaxID=1157962 RepID=A0A250XPC3_9CHLO|nr:hypothetical protein CEUSTIGMA_g12342.t1 [Chlamydomonas eustigma]|eukprot:GAX84921.1 hypothetical protein CEUSTIGMA_g12342.t1 [Chlamydomonas eustigma]